MGLCFDRAHSRGLAGGGSKDDRAEVLSQSNRAGQVAGVDHAAPQLRSHDMVPRRDGETEGEDEGDGRIAIQ